MNLKTFNDIRHAANLDDYSLEKLRDLFLEQFVTNENTLRAKRNDFHKLFKFIRARVHRDPSVADFTKATIERFRDHGLSEGQSLSTVNRELKTFKHFATKMADRSVFFNDIRDIPFLKMPLGDSRALTEEEHKLIRFFANHGKTEFHRARNRAIIEFMSYTGVRANELCSLLQGDIEGDWIPQLKGKGLDFREVYIPEELRPILAEWERARDAELTRRFPAFALLSVRDKRRFPYFISFYGARLDKPESFRVSYEAIKKLCQQVAAKAGIPLTSHRFRHTSITGMLDAGVDLPTVARCHGHRVIQTTVNYAQPRREKIAAAFERRAKR